MTRSIRMAKILSFMSTILLVRSKLQRNTSWTYMSIDTFEKTQCLNPLKCTFGISSETFFYFLIIERTKNNYTVKAIQKIIKEFQ